MRTLTLGALAAALLCSACASGVRRADVTPAEHFSASGGPNCQVGLDQLV
jgi:hypothetical protein